MSIHLAAQATASGTELRHFWSTCVGAGRANEGLRAAWLEQLRQVVHGCGFRYVRFHGLFHDDMFVYREQAGQGLYNFQYIDDLFDRMLAAGVRPFVELGFCPGDIASEKGTVFWWKGHGSPPKDYAKWGELVRRFAQHCLDRYGQDEVRQWYFEVWNEPNLHPFFRGTRSQYFELYKVSAQALKSVDPQLRVGGPATSNFVPDGRFDGEREDLACHAAVTKAKDLDALDWHPVWVETFLAFCQHEGLPVDFVSCHPYPTDWALDEHGKGSNYTRGVNSTRLDLQAIRRMVAASPYPQAEIHLTEWNSSPSPRDFTHDFLQAATYIVKANLEAVGLVDSLSYWTFTDVFEEGGAGNTVFHGGFGMINYQGIVKPAFHAYRFLHSLGDECLSRVPGGVLTRDRRSGHLAALAYHYPPEMPLAVPTSRDSRDLARRTLALGQAESLAVALQGLAPGAPFVLETLDREHGNVMAAWEGMGSPEPPTREQSALLRQAAAATRREFLRADTQGNLHLERRIEPWSVVLLRQL